MKKTLLFFITVLFALSVSGQVIGDGRTPTTAYYGTISTPTTWTYLYNGGTIFVGQTGGNEDLTIVTGGSLSIEAGVTIRFCTTASDLKITGSGVLTAVGTSSSLITFTRNLQATWGHISFEASTGNSLINYSIIEYGFKNGSSIDGYGGGIHANTNNLSISNCIIRNNYALWGGAVFVNQNRFPSISNCYIYNNISGHGGGGFYFWNGARSVVTNCIFDSNHCLEPSVAYYTGGGLAGQSATSLKILNCTFVNNTSTQSAGKSIMLYYSAGDLVLNCIVWSNINTGNQFYLSGANTIQNTAVIGSIPIGTGNITLSTTNSDPLGPNFINPASSDWSIKFISPCRDAGTSLGAPPTDYLANGRIGNYDIGAYEVQYSNWTGTTSTEWATATNWSSGSVPISGASDVIIPYGLTNYPINTPAPNFTVGPGKIMVLNPGAKATLGSLVNNGSLTLQCDAASGPASLITGSYSGNDATIELHLTGGEAGGTGTKTFRWHYISTPVSSIPISTFVPTYTTNLAKYWDDRVSGSLSAGWVKYDGYIYSTAGTDPVRQFVNLLPGIGYDFYAVQDNKITFSGQLNTSDVTMNLSFAVNDALHGFNLLGNPYSSGLDWSVISSDPSFPLSTSKTVYFTRNNTQCSFVGGVGIPSDVTGIIPPMQGFFVKTYTAGNSMKIPAAARAQTAIHSRYKGEIIVPLVRLSIAENLVTDETVVRFDEAAKSGVDYDFDAIKMFISTTSTQIYSSIGGTNYSINGLPYPTPSIEIPIVVNFLTTGNHSINATQLQGLDNYNVTLTDNNTGFVADLKAIPIITFSATAGTITDRFVLKVGTITTGTENPPSANGTFNIYSSFGSINIQTLADDWDGKSGSVKVLDLSGKVVSSGNNITFSKNSLTTVTGNFTKGIYLVELKSGIKRYVGKVALR